MNKIVVELIDKKKLTINLFLLEAFTVYPLFLRMNLDSRDFSAEHSQRMLNAIEPATVLPIHRHGSRRHNHQHSRRPVAQPEELGEWHGAAGG